jgi:putative cardiolipin synthase
MKLLQRNPYLLTVVFIVFLSSCSSLPTDFEKTNRYALTNTQDSTLGIIATEMLSDSPELSAMQIIDKGRDAFLTRLALLKMAEHSIDVQYFIWKSDIIGNLLMLEMLAAADRGVRVRILLDDINLDDETKATLFAMDHHPNIDFRIYNPVSSTGYFFASAISDAARVNHRMHNKSFIADSQYIVVGGRNIEGNYFAANASSNFEDIDVIAVGPVVSEVNTEYDLYFNSPLAIPGHVFHDYTKYDNKLDSVKTKLQSFVDENSESNYVLDLKDTDLYKDYVNQIIGANGHVVYRGIAQVIYDSPEKTLGKSSIETTYLQSLIAPHVDKISQSLELVSPYFIPGDTGTEKLVSFVNNGIKVTVLTNSLASTDGIMAQSGYSRKRIDLLEGGVELYELKPKGKSKASHSLRQSGEAMSALHAKTYVFDRNEVFIGSFNLDPRSQNINTELGVVYQIPEMAEFVASEIFDKDLINIAYRVILENGELVWIEHIDGKEIRHTTEPETSWWRRFNMKFYSILPIESQL